MISSLFETEKDEEFGEKAIAVLFSKGTRANNFRSSEIEKKGEGFDNDFQSLCITSTLKKLVSWKTKSFNEVELPPDSH